MTTEITLHLADHEATIERGLKTFVDVGNALAAIRDGKLYKADHATFEDYCKERWGWTRVRAYQLIDAAAVVDNVAGLISDNSRMRDSLKFMGETVKMMSDVNNCLHRPATESQARPLTKLPADEQADAWEEVVAESEQTGEKITAKKVEAVVAKRRGEQVVVDTETGEIVEPAAASPKAHRPTRTHTTSIAAKTALDLPHDPHAAAKTLVEFFDRPYLITLVESINEIIER